MSSIQQKKQDHEHKVDHAKDSTLVKLKTLLKAHKYIALIALALLVSLLFALGSLMNLRKNSQVASGCSDELIYEASNLIINRNDQGYLDMFEKTVQKIEQTTSFDKDINCLYPLVYYYTEISDYDKSKQYFDKLEDLSKQGQVISGNFQPPLTVEQLKMRVDHLKRFSEEIEQNTVLIGEPIQAEGNDDE